MSAKWQSWDSSQGFATVCMFAATHPPKCSSCATTRALRPMGAVPGRVLLGPRGGPFPKCTCYAEWPHFPFPPAVRASFPHALAHPPFLSLPLHCPGACGLYTRVAIVSQSCMGLETLETFSCDPVATGELSWLTTPRQCSYHCISPYLRFTS